MLEENEGVLRKCMRICPSPISHPGLRGPPVREAVQETGMFCSPQFIIILHKTGILKLSQISKTLGTIIESITQTKSYNDTLTRCMKAFSLTQFTLQMQRTAEMEACPDTPVVRYPAEPWQVQG